MRGLIKQLLGALVDLFAQARGYKFPTKYTWRWKLDALTNQYEPETTALFLELLRPGMTVVDVGAHIGYFTRICAARIGKNGHLFAFEADSENFDLLRKNTAKFANISLIPLAVSSHVGTVDFYHLPASTGCHSTLAPEGAAKKVSVEATTLDLFVAEQVKRPVDLLKMDIEGGEWEAFKGMENIFNQPHLQLIVEWNPESLKRAGIDPVQLLTHLSDRGFTLTALTPLTRIPLAAATLSDTYRHLSKGGSVNIYARK